MLERCRRLIVRLYPRPWRARYGEEFEALLDDSPARWRDLPDLARGALAMQLRSQPAWKTAAIFGLLGLLVAGVTELRQPPNYTASARIQASNPKVVPFLSLHALNGQALLQTIVRLDLYPRDQRRLPSEDLVELMRRDLRVDADPGNPAEFTLHFRHPDAQKARAAVRDLVAEFMYENVRQSMLSTIANSTLEQSRAANLTGVQAPALSTPLLVWGLTLGALAGWLIRQRLRRVLQLAGFAVAGLIGLGAPSYLIDSSYMSTAVVAVKETPPAGLPGVEVKPVALPSGSPRLVYRLSATHTDRFQAQRNLMAVIHNDAKAEIIEPPTLPSLPISPNRAAPAVFGALSALAFGLHRTRHLRKV